MQRGERGGRFGWLRLSALFLALTPGVSLGFTPEAAPPGVDIVLTLPEMPEPGANIGPRAVPLGTINLGELSPQRLDEMAAGTIRVGIYSPLGRMPRYRVRARLLTQEFARFEDFGPTDVGLGVYGIVATRPIVNPLFDYSPYTVSHDADGQPRFRGTLGSITGASGQVLYQAGAPGFGRWNFFTFALASAPQFYTPIPFRSRTVELSLEVLP